MCQRDFLTVTRICNETENELRLYLEMLGAEVVVAPGHVMELLAGQQQDVLPITIHYVQGGLQIHPYKQFDPEWHVKFKDKVIPVSDLTVLAEHE